MLNLEAKYLRNLHTSLLPMQPTHTQCYYHNQEERVFERTFKRWTIGIFAGMVFGGGAVIVLYISTLPY